MQKSSPNNIQMDVESFFKLFFAHAKGHGMGNTMAFHNAYKRKEYLHLADKQDEE